MASTIITSLNPQRAADALLAPTHEPHATCTAAGWRLRFWRYDGRARLGAMLWPYGRGSKVRDYDWLGELVSGLASPDARALLASLNSEDETMREPSEPMYLDWPTREDAPPMKPIPRGGDPLATLPEGWTSELWAESDRGVYGQRYRHVDGTLVTCSDAPLAPGFMARARFVQVSGAPGPSRTTAASRLFVSPSVGPIYEMTTRTGNHHFSQVVELPLAEPMEWDRRAAEAMLGAVMKSLRDYQAARPTH